MSGEDASKLEGSDVHLSVGGGAASVAKELGDEPKCATRDLVDLVTEATWNEALSQVGGLPSNPLPLWLLLASRILRAVAYGERDPQSLKRFALDGLNEDDGFGK
jgi:hypothetical protein